MRQLRLLSLALLFIVTIGSAYGQVWTQSFNGTAIPSGWAQSNSCNSTSTNASWKMTTTVPGYGASGFIDHTGSTGSYAMWVDGSSPYPCEVSVVTDFINVTALTAPSVEFFWAKNNNGTYVGNNILEVDVFDGTTYYNVFADSTDAADWQKAVIDLSCNSTVAALDSFALRFKVIKNSGSASFYNDIIVDDIKVQEKPSCAAPATLAVSNITTSANVDVFDATCTGTVAATSAKVIYGIIGFDPSNPNSGQTATATNGSATITGLANSLVYAVYAYNDCGSGVSSDTIGPFFFTTPCGTVTTPYTESFDAGSSGTYLSASMPNCWEYYSDGTYPYYYVRNLSTYANSGTQMVYGYKTSTTGYGDTAFFATPAIQGLDSATKQVSFYTRTSSATYSGMVIVGVTDANATPSSFKAIDTVYSGLSYQKQIVMLDSTSGIASGDARVAFAWIYDGNLDYVYIDDITVEAIPDCPIPFSPTLVSVGSSAATLSWSGLATTYYLEYGPAGFTQGNGTLDTATSSTHTLTGLASDTDYDVYIMADCSAASKGTSAWSSALSFKTNCGALATPISEDFDGVTAGSYTNAAMPNCWQYYSNGTYPYWYVRNYSAYANSGTNMVYGYKSTGTPNGTTYGDTAYFASPQVQGLDSATKMVKFYARTSSVSYSGMVIVGVTDELASPGSFKAVDTVYASTSYAQYQVYLDNNAGVGSGDARVAFAWIYDGILGRGDRFRSVGAV